MELVGILLSSVAVATDPAERDEELDRDGRGDPEGCTRSKIVGDADTKLRPVDDRG